MTTDERVAALFEIEADCADRSAAAGHTAEAELAYYAARYLRLLLGGDPHDMLAHTRRMLAWAARDATHPPAPAPAVTGTTDQPGAQQ